VIRTNLPEPDVINAVMEAAKLDVA
jgi:hypothetical protein